ncbi:hypothetical protein D3C86_1141820 [compost metagenome]
MQTNETSNVAPAEEIVELTAEEAATVKGAGFWSKILNLGTGGSFGTFTRR